MGVGFAGQRKVVFFPGQESLALIGEAEVLILLADADYRVSAEIGLFNLCLLYTSPSPRDTR